MITLTKCTYWLHTHIILVMNVLFFIYAHIFTRLFSFHAVLIEVGCEFTQYVTSEGQGAVDLSIIIFDPYTGRAPRPFTLSVSTEDGSASMYIPYCHFIQKFIISSHVQWLLATIEL